MITNTQRILYEDGYYPAYQKNTEKKIYNLGYHYQIEKFKEVHTSQVWRVECNNGLVTYFSDCTLFTDIRIPKHIADIQAGDNIEFCYPWMPFSDKATFGRTVLRGFLFKEDIDKIYKVYKIKDLKKFKLLANNKDFISDFLCSLVKNFFKDFRYDWIIVKNLFNYELLQEIILAFSMFGVYAEIRKEKGKWVLFINSNDFMKNLSGPIGYSTKTIPVKSIKEIKQDTQSFKVSLINTQDLVVNNIRIQGD
jgi:hypothetical protein